MGHIWAINNTRVILFSAHVFCLVFSFSNKKRETTEQQLNSEPPKDKPVQCVCVCVFNIGRIGRYSVPMKPLIPRREKVWWIFGAKTLKGWREEGWGEHLWSWKYKDTKGWSINLKVGTGCGLSLDFLDSQIKVVRFCEWVLEILFLMMFVISFKVCVYKESRPIHFHLRSYRGTKIHWRIGAKHLACVFFDGWWNRIHPWHPWSLTWNLKINPWKRRFRTWKPSFSGSMLNFGGVSSWKMTADWNPCPTI